MKTMQDNGYFIASPQHDQLVVDKAHFCTWNLPNGLEFLEVGMLVHLKDEFWKGLKEYQLDPRLDFKVHIPFYEDDSSCGDLFCSLKEPDNARFVFNDQITHTDFISDGGKIPQGVLFSFREGGKFCLLPLVLESDYSNPNTVVAKVEFPRKGEDCLRIGNRIYCRFFVVSKGKAIPWERGGIAKTTICYDIKINEPRNAPTKFPLDQLVAIRSCYCIHVVPSSFESSLQDRVAFKSIRTLEPDGYSDYTKGIHGIQAAINPGDCLVVFNKLKNTENPKLPFSFFTLFTKERIGPSQLALAIGANIICGILSAWSWIAALVFLVLAIAGIWIWHRNRTKISSISSRG